MNQFSKIIISTIFISLLSGGAIVAAAPSKPATIPCVPSLPCVQKTTQEKGGSEVRKYVLETWGAAIFMNTFLGMCAITAVVFIVVGGLQLHLAAGNDETLGKGKKTITWAIAGLVISLLAVIIVQIVTRIPLK